MLNFGLRRLFNSNIFRSDYWSHSSFDIGVDLGTTNTVIFTSDPGPSQDFYPVNIPSVVAFNREKDKVVAVGQKAKEMIGRRRGAVEIICPIQDGVISDTRMAGELLKFALKTLKQPRFRRKCKNLLIGVPLDTRDLHHKELKRVAFECAGAEIVHIVPQPMLAAIGAGMDVNRKEAQLVIDVGGGTTDIAVIALGDVAYGQSIRFAGDRVDEAIIAHAKEQGLILGKQRAESLKIQASMDNGSAPKEGYAVDGRDTKTGTSKRIHVKPEEIEQVLVSPIKEITKGLMAVLTSAPPELAELAGDLFETGVWLTGGGAPLRGLKTAIEGVGFPVTIAPDPLLCVAKGIGEALEKPELLIIIMISTTTKAQWLNPRPKRVQRILEAKKPK